MGISALALSLRTVVADSLPRCCTSVSCQSCSTCALRLLSVLSVFTPLQTVGFQFSVFQFSVFGFASFHFPETACFHEVLQRSTINTSEMIFLPIHGGSNGRGVSFLLDTGGRLSGIFAQWFLMMDDRLWRLLEESGCTCVSELRIHFATPWHLACSVDSLEDSVTLAEQVLPRALASEHKRTGGQIWKWISDHTDLLSRVQSRLCAKATRIEAAASNKVSPGEVFDQLVSGSIDLVSQTSRAHARWISNGAGNPAEAEKAARKFWGTVLVQIMVEAKLPITEIPVENEEQRIVYALRALGTRRSKTLRNRARAWRKARDWFMSVKEYAYPRGPSDVVDYIIFLEQEAGTKSCIADFMSALSVLEDAGQVPSSGQLCKNRLVVAASKGASAEVQQGKTSVKQAPPLTVAMLLALEIYVCTGSNPLYARCLMWACLLCVWGCMRVSDLQGIDVSRLRLFRDGLKGFLVKTKTTGPDKKVAEVPFFVGRNVGLSGRDWLSAGYKLWRDLGQLDRTFLVFQSTPDFEEPCYKFAKPEVISNYMRLIWRQLKVPFRKLGENAWKSRSDGELLGAECYLFWSGHSMRHVLPTIAAIFGIPKEQRDYLGRWHVGLHQSADYIHTCRQIVHDIQRKVCDKLSGGQPGYDEEELFEDFRVWLRGRGLDPDPWVKLHSVMRTVNGCKVLNQTWPLLGDFTERPDEAAVALPSSNLGQDDKQSPFWVSISRHSGHRRLHIRNGCWVTPGSCHQFAEIWEVDASVADSFCKLCYKNKEGSSSSSGESSSTDLGEPAEGGVSAIPAFGTGL